MADNLSDLPEEVAAVIRPHLEPDDTTLDAISNVIAARRDEAKAARAGSGIEQVWADCEEAYLGIDDSNRDSYRGMKWQKPMSMDGAVSTGDRRQSPRHQSNVYLPMTRRYVNAGADKLCEIILSPDERSFSISETPKPELIDLKKSTYRVDELLGSDVPATRAARPDELAPQQPAQSLAVPPVAPPAGGAVPQAGGVAPAEEQRVPITAKDIAEEQVAIAQAAAKKEEQQIWDWHVECQRNAAARAMINDAARIGTGVLKGPVPRIAKQRVINKTAGGSGIDLIFRKVVKPVTQWVDPWNIFPDPACGENIHDGDFILERDFMTRRQLRKLRDEPDYVASQIDKVLLNDPETNESEQRPEKGAEAETKGRYEVWYYYGVLPREDMECICAAAGGKALKDRGIADDRREINVIATLVGRHVIRATINPLESGEFPYHVFSWQRRAGYWAGVGVAEQLTPTQNMLNAATRSMLNNAGLSSGVQVVIDRTALQPVDGSWTLAPGKAWVTTTEAAGRPVEQLFKVFVIPSATNELMAINQFAMQQAEESTSIPLVTQGQSGKTTPDTYGATQLQDNNANQLLRALGYRFDDLVTGPETRQYHEWYLLDDEIDAKDKGDFTISAHGSSALVERSIQEQTIVQVVLPLSANPIYDMSPPRTAEQVLKIKRLDKRDFVLTDEEKAERAKQPAPAAPQIEVAKIRQQTDMARLEADQQVATAQLGHDRERDAADISVELRTIELKRELALLDYANRNQMSLTTAKKDLAKTQMEIDAQERLAHADRSHALNGSSQVAHAAAEPPGRAEPGKAFYQ